MANPQQKLAPLQFADARREHERLMHKVNWLGALMTEAVNLLDGKVNRETILRLRREREELGGRISGALLSSSKQDFILLDREVRVLELGVIGHVKAVAPGELVPLLRASFRTRREVFFPLKPKNSGQDRLVVQIRELKGEVEKHAKKHEAGLMESLLSGGQEKLRGTLCGVLYGCVALENMLLQSGKEHEVHIELVRLRAEAKSILGAKYGQSLPK